MKNILILTILISSLLVFCSYENDISNDLTQNNYKISLDTAFMVFQNFHNQTLTSEFDTTIVVILYEENKTTITRILSSSGYGGYTIIHKKENQYTIEKESADSKCKINIFEPEYYNLGKLLVGSCWRGSGGMPYLDSGVRIIFSTLYGEILYKGFQTNSGKVIYTINGVIIPITQRQELIEK